MGLFEGQKTGMLRACSSSRRYWWRSKWYPNAGLHPEQEHSHLSHERNQGRWADTSVLTRSICTCQYRPVEGCQFCAESTSHLIYFNLCNELTRNTKPAELTHTSGWKDSILLWDHSAQIYRFTEEKMENSFARCVKPVLRCRDVGIFNSSRKDCCSCMIQAENQQIHGLITPLHTAELPAAPTFQALEAQFCYLKVVQDTVNDESISLSSGGSVAVLRLWLCDWQCKKDFLSTKMLCSQTSVAADLCERTSWHWSLSKLMIFF